MPSEGRIRSGLMLVGGTGVEVVLPFLRSVALAHLISPTQFGLATALAVASGFAELITDIGLHNAAMRQGGGENSQSDVLPTLHTILLTRCTFLGVLLALAGAPLAAFFHAPEMAWSFSLLGLVAFLRGLMHIQVKEMMRNYVYGPDAIANITATVFGTGMTILTAYLFRDYSCILWGMFAATISQIIATHLVSPTPFRLGWNKAVARETLIYGAPLMPNGIALAVSGMGDRFLVGSSLGPTTLAFYNVGTMSAFMPRGIILRLMMAVAVPIFLNRGREGTAKARVFDYWTVFLSLLSAFYALSFLCFGSLLVGLVFGQNYAPAQDLATLLSVSVYLKFMLVLATPAALAFGQTRLVLLSSMLAAMALGCGALFLFAAPTLTNFLFGVASGELVAALWIIYRSIKLYPASVTLTWFATLFPLVVLVVSHLFCNSLAPDEIVRRLIIYACASVVLAAAFFAALKASRLAIVPPFLRKRLLQKRV